MDGKPVTAACEAFDQGPSVLMSRRPGGMIPIPQLRGKVALQMGMNCQDSWFLPLWL